MDGEEGEAKASDLGEVQRDKPKGMLEAENMDDLSDGVHKLLEFSSVLSSVTRGLDKNVRRLDDQFGKANVALKIMKETVDETTDMTNQLRKEQDEQLSELQDAVKVAASIYDGTDTKPAEPSDFMLDERLLGDCRPLSVVTAEEEAKKRTKEEQDELELRESTNSDNRHKPWVKMVDDATTISRRQLGLTVNEALHNMNKTLVKPAKVAEMTEEEKALDTKEAREAKEVSLTLNISILVVFCSMECCIRQL